MKKNQLRSVLVVGDDASVQRALGELVAQAVAESGRGQTLVMTAHDDGDVLRALSRGQIDIVLAAYRDEGRGVDLLAWLSHGKFPARTVLISSEGPRGEAGDWRARGVDAVVRRPATKEDLKLLIVEWFP